MEVRAIVLAAGASRRMGHPKALTRLPTQPALARIVATCAEAGLARPLVVVGEHESQVRAALPALDVEWVRNPAPDQGRTGSLRCALARLDAPRALVWPVDHPLVRADTLARLLAHAQPVVVPVYAGRGGHPLVLSGAALDEARALAPDAPLRDVVRHDPRRVARVEVHDPGVRQNLDTPDDLEKLQEE